MGIEDFDIESEAYADRVLLIAPNEARARELGELLDKRGYFWLRVPTIAEGSRQAAEQLFDLILLDSLGSARSLREIYAELRAQGALVHTPAVVLTDAEHDSLPPGAENKLTVLSGPLDPKTLMIKVATQLRLRKIAGDQAQFEARIAAQNAELRDLNNRFRKELKEAHQLHSALLPKILPRAPHTKFAVCCLPLEVIGGDLYDVWEMESGSYGLFIADATGHGLSAAFIGAMLKMALAYSPQQSIDEMFAQINDKLCDYLPAGRFVTAAAARWEPSLARLQIVRAGHPPPYLWRAKEQSLAKVAVAGLPFGVSRDMPYELFETELKTGDKLLMVTDGMTETATMSGELLGIDGLGDLFAQAAQTLSIDRCIESLLQKQQELGAGRVRKDDITLLGMEFHQHG